MNIKIKKHDMQIKSIHIFVYTLIINIKLIILYSANAVFSINFVI